MHERPMRRDFLKLCGLAGLGLAVPLSVPEPIRAEDAKNEPYEGPYYVVFNASGGWDTTYLMDPKGINGINRLYKEGDILTRGTAQVRPDREAHAKGGMSNEDFYAEFGDELLVLQRPRLLGQQSLARRPLHGDRQARQHGLPDVRRARRRVPGAGLPARVPHLRQLLGDRQPRGHVARSRTCRRCRRSPTPTRSRATRQLAVPRQVRPRPDRGGAPRREPRPTPRSRACRGRSMRRTCSTRPRPTRRRWSASPRTSRRTIPKERLSQQAEIALASFKAGVCVSANLTIGQFDSHANNDTDQMKLIPEFLAGIALPDAPGRGIEDPRPAGRRSPRARWAGPRTTTTATARITGRSARSCSSAGASRAIASSAPPTRSSSPSRSIRRPWPRQGEGHPRPPRAHPRGASRIRRHRRPSLQQEIPSRRGREGSSAGTVGMIAPLSTPRWNSVRFVFSLAFGCRKADHTIPA